jgi:hypothetical protein
MAPLTICDRPYPMMTGSWYSIWIVNFMNTWTILYCPCASLGEYDIEIILPYPRPPWTMTLEGVNGPNYIWHSLSHGHRKLTFSVYDIHLHCVCAWCAATWIPWIPCVPAWIPCVPVWIPCVHLYGYPVCLPRYPVCLCMDTLWHCKTLKRFMNLCNNIS